MTSRNLKLTRWCWQGYGSTVKMMPRRTARLTADMAFMYLATLPSSFKTLILLLNGSDITESYPSADYSS